MRFRSFTLGSPAVAALTVLVALACSCSSKASLAGQGAECSVTTDCQSGLVCIPQKNGSSICSNNLGSIQDLPPIPDSGPAASNDGSGDDGPGILIPDDTGAPTSTDAAGD